MAKPWSEVAASDGFKSLPPEQQDGARRQYFDDVVAPQVPASERETVWGQFSTDVGMGRRELPAGVAPSAAGGGRGSVNPIVTQAGAQPSRAQRIAEMDALTDPTNLNYAQPASKPRSSVLEGMQMPERPFDAQEAERLSSRAYAERTPIPGTPRRELPTMRASTGPGVNPRATGLGESLQDSSLPVRALAKAGAGIVQGVGGVARALGDVTGIDGLARGGAETAKQADQFQQGMGTISAPEGFGPKSPVPYLVDMAEGATSSLAQSAALAAAFGPGAVIPLMSVQTAGQEYDKARKQGLDPAMALAGAIPKGAFEAIGEKFTGLDKVASAMGTLLTKGSSELAKRTAGEVLIRSGIREIPGEMITYLGQTGVDLLPGIGLNPDLTMRGFLDGMRDTVVQAGMMGGAMGGAGAITSRTGTDQPAAQTSAETMAKSKGFLVREGQIKQLRDAGETATADLMQQKHDKATATESVDGELLRMPGNPEFQASYRQMRTAGIKPAEAAARSAVTTSYQGLAATAGIPEKAAAAALEKAATLPLDQVPGFFAKFTAGLAKRGLVQPFEGMDSMAAGLEVARDDAIEAAMGAAYQPEPEVRQAMDDVMALEAVQHQQAEPELTSGLPDASMPDYQIAQTEKGFDATENVASKSMEDVPVANLPAPAPALAGQPIDKNWTAFTPESGTLSVPRADMPQVKAEHRGAMVNFLKARGIDSQQGEVPADSLKPTQAEFSPQKVARAAGFEGGDRSILISSDGHVLDGHHQWLAKREAGEPVKVIQLGAPIAELLDAVREFPSAGVSAGADLSTTSPSRALQTGDDARRAEILKSQDDLTGSTRAANLSYMIEQAEQALQGQLKYPFPNKASQDETVADWRQKIGDYQAILPAAEQADRTDQRKGIDRSMLQGAKAELDVAMANGDMSRQEAQDAIEKARTTGNAADASESILKAVDAKTTLNPDGTLSIKGNSAAIKARLAEAGLTGIPMKGGMQVGRKQAAKAQSVFKPKAPIAQERPAPSAINSISEPAANGNLSSTAAEQRAAHAAAEAKRTAAGKRARANAYDKNPFKAFIAKHGIASDQASEFVPGVQERRKAMVPGYGPIFRKSGLSLDMLADRAVEDGFLLEADEPALYALIERVMRDEKIIPQYARGVAEEEMDARIKEMQAAYEEGPGLLTDEDYERQSQDEADALEALRDVSDDALFNMSDDEALFGPRLSLDEFNQENDHETAQQSGRKGQDDKGRGSADEAVPAKAQGVAGQGNGPSQPGADSGLTAPSQQDVLNQQDRAEAAAKTEKAKQRAADELARRERVSKDIAKASEAAADTFTLGGDAEQNLSGQGGMFDEPAPATSQTDTPAFKQWFKGSKVVDATGKPLIMYHGTSASEEGEAFTSFDTYGSNYGLMGAGAYFTDSAEVAGSYTTKGKGKTPTVYALFLSIKKPMDMEAKADATAWKKQFTNAEDYHDGGATNESWYRAAENALADENVPAYEGAEIMQDGLRAMGYDGITHIGGGRVKSDGVKHRVYIAFDPEQVKSATGNNGDFDSKNHRIAFAREMSDDAFLRMFSPPSSMPMTEVQKAVDELSAKWKNGPAIQIVATPRNFPIRAPADARGLIYQGTAYIAAINHRSRDDVARTLAHEAIGHFGLWRILGANGTKRFSRNLQLAVKSGNVPLNKIAAKVRRLYVDDKGSFNLSAKQESDEIAAFAVEDAVDPATGAFKPGYGFVKEVYAKLAAWLRDTMGIKIPFTMAELHGMLVSAMRGLEAGKRLEGGGKSVAAFSFSGERAKTADTHALATARQRLDAGEDADVVRKATGWSQGADGKMRFEISDKDALLKAELDGPNKHKTIGRLFAGEDYQTLGSVLHHPALFAAYPMLEDLPIKFVSSIVNPGVKGAFGEDGISINSDASPADALSTMLHEIQHGIQEVEGFAKGGNPESIRDTLQAIAAQKRGYADFAKQKLDDASDLEKAAGYLEIIRQLSNNPAGITKTMLWYEHKPAFVPKLGKERAQAIIATAEKAAQSLRSEIQSGNAANYMRSNGYATEPKELRRLARQIIKELPQGNKDDLAIVRKLDAALDKYSSHDLYLRLAGEVEARNTQTRAGMTDAERRATSPESTADVKAADVIVTFNGKEMLNAPAPDNGSAFARGVPTPGPGLFQPNIWSAPDPTRTDRIIYELQDGKVDLKRVQQAITKSGQQIAEKWDARLAETLYPGRVAYRSHTFLEIEAKPLLEAMTRNNVPMNELADYLHARGAEERNKQIAKVNPAMPDGGAGTNSEGTLLTTQAARDYLANVRPARKVVLDAMAKRVDTITAGTRRLLVAEGLEKQETIDAWEGAYKNYVPMFRDEAESAMPPHPQGSGFSVKGSASKRATGSTKEVTNILAHVLMQREAAITRAEKNRVALALYGQALSHPNPEFWTTIKPSMSNSQIGAELTAMGVDPLTAQVGMEGVPTIRTVDKATGKVVDRANPMYQKMPGAIPLKVNGEDRVLMLNVTSERGQRLAESLKNLDGLTQLDLAGSIIGKSTRWLAAVNTQYNPAFGLVNLTRDTLGGAIHLGNTELRGHALEVLAKTPAAILGIARELASGGQSGKWQTLYRQFQADGGQTGFRENFRDPNDRAKAIEKELTNMGGSMLARAGRTAHLMLDLLDGFNTSLENAVRLSAYSAGLDNGMSRAKAARLGRELTVDFNRKGRAGREIGPLYAFFNASVQGMDRTMQAIKGPTGGKIIAGGLSLGVVQALMLLAAGYDDDEIPEFVKTRALIIPMFGKEKTYISIPYPLGLHVLPNTGRVLAELVLNGGKDIIKRSVAAIGEIAGAFNPLGGGNILTADGALKTVAPTLIDPLIEIGFNRNFAGGKIEKEGYGGESDNRPGVARTKEATQRSTTGQAYMGISKAINTLTGGTDYEAGKLSPTPERVRYLAQTVGGGVLREIEKTVNASTAAARGDKVKMSQIPVAGRFYGEVDPDQVQMSRYYDSSSKLKTLESSFKAMVKAGDADAARKFMDEHPEIAMAHTAAAVQQKVAALNKVAVQTVSDPAMMKQIDEARVANMAALNQALKAQEDAAGKPTLAAKLRETVKPKAREAVIAQ